MAFGQELATEEDGRVSALSTAIMLLVGLGAWLGWSAVRSAASGPTPSPGVLVLETTLTAVAVAGIESSVVGLLPMQFMVGARVVAWSRAVWALLLGVSLFAFIHILLRPGSGYVGQSSTGSALAVALLFVGFGLVSVIFWGYFRLRRPRPGLSTRGQAVGHGTGRSV